MEKQAQEKEALWKKALETAGPFDPEQEKALLSRIVMSPGVLDGLPVIKNTGIPAEVVLELLGRGLPEREIRDIPSLSEEDLRAVFLYVGTLVPDVNPPGNLAARGVGIGIAKSGLPGKNRSSGKGF